MPRLYKEVNVDTYVDVDVDIDVEEFLEECTLSEIEEVLNYLEDQNYIKRGQRVTSPAINSMEIDYINALNKLQNKRIYLTLEEEQLILNLANKF